MCEREGEGEGEGQRVQTDLCERGVIFEFSLFKTRVSETRFYFSKPSLRDTRSTWEESTWRVHVELEFLTLEFHVDMPRGFCPHQETETKP